MAKFLRRINYNGTNYEIADLAYAVCSTPSATLGKVVDSGNSLDFELLDGIKVVVKFENAVTMQNSTLKVGNTAAKLMKYNGVVLGPDVIKANQVCQFVYSSTEDAWIMVGGTGSGDVDLSDVMIIKGSVSPTSGLPAVYEKGATYIVDTAGNITIGSGANAPTINSCEVGDIIICIDSNDTAANASASDWTVIQANVTSHNIYMVKGVDYVTAGKNPSITMGTGATAEGIGTQPTGNYSHAEGSGTIASSLNSHVEGGGSKAQGEASHAEGSGTTANKIGAHSEGGGTKATGNYSHAEGEGTEASGLDSHSEGGGTTASGSYSHAEGGGTTASGTHAHAEGASTIASGAYSHAEGANSKAQNQNAHAEGVGTTASGIASHAEGAGSIASNNQSHAEGVSTTASGVCSHSEGGNTTASGDYSHSEGYYTTANHKSQHAFGEYNILDSSIETAANRGDYVEIVGNGTASNARSNARTLDWNGNEVLAGSLTVGAAQAIASNESVKLEYNSTTKSLDFIFA